jgi:hypothetical protein
VGDARDQSLLHPTGRGRPGAIGAAKEFERVFAERPGIGQRLLCAADLPIRGHRERCAVRPSTVDRVLVRARPLCHAVHRPLEGVDWSLFDIVSTDAAYRTAAMASTFRANVRAFVEQARAQGKAVAVTEFGCGTYRNAGAMASRDGIGTIVWGPGGRPVKPNGDFVRDEHEQVNYIRESLEVFDAEGVEAAFVYAFARYDMPYRADPKLDLDMMGAGIVRVLDEKSGAVELHRRRYPDMPWEPKAAFDFLADWHHAAQRERARH